MSFVHDDKDFDALVRIVANKRRLSLVLVEKDYWATHTLWALLRSGFEVWLKGGTSLSKEERGDVLERFREGRLRALVSARVLNEGLDVPDAVVGIIVAGGLGKREHVQRVGRVLRPREGKRALVYELIVPASSEVGQVARRVGALHGGISGTV